MYSGGQFLEKLATQNLIGGNAYLLGNNGADPFAREAPTNSGCSGPT